MVVILLDVRMRFPSSRDRKDCKYRSVIRIVRRHGLVHSIPGTEEKYRRDIVRRRLYMMETYPPYFKGNVLSNFLTYYF